MSTRSPVRGARARRTRARWIAHLGLSTALFLGLFPELFRRLSGRLLPLPFARLLVLPTCPMLGASLNEIGLVALLLVIVLLAAKVGKIGEAVGGFFARSSAPEPGSEGAKDDKPEGS